MLGDHWDEPFADREALRVKGRGGGRLRGKEGRGWNRGAPSSTMLQGRQQPH